MPAIIGIYKIVNPKGRIYVGQSINIKFRLTQYKYYKCKTQSKLYNSLKKYGFELHLCEIIEECFVEELNNRERYYQEFYDSVKKGLNCRLTGTNDKNGIISEQTRKKMSNKKQGYTPCNKGKTRFDLQLLQKLVNNKLTQQNIAEIMGTHQGTISKYIKKHNIKIKTK
jgi:group I intron endonuclease